MQELPVDILQIGVSEMVSKEVDSTLHPEHFGELWLRMKKIQGPVTIFASPDVQEANDYLCSLTKKFADMVIGKLILLATKSKSESDKYDNSARDFFLTYQRAQEIYLQPNEDIQPLLGEFREKLREMLQIMRKDLSSGSFVQKERSET